MPPAGQLGGLAMDLPSPNTSPSVGRESCACFVSRAQMSFAAWIARRLLWQALYCAWLRALTKLGMAMAANIPITTIHKMDR